MTCFSNQVELKVVTLFLSGLVTVEAVNEKAIDKSEVCILFVTFSACQNGIFMN